MAITLIAGPPCSGKSTLARRLAKPGDVVLDFDDICVELGSPDRWEHDDAIRADAELEMQRRIWRLPYHDGDGYLIRCAPMAGRRAHLADRLNATVWVLDPGWAECVRRARADGRPRGTVGAIAQWYRQYRPSPRDSVCPSLDVTQGDIGGEHVVSRRW